ncbi:MAG: M56 family metallopeptidase, partial [Acidobacteriia bacterium]|nr:M56 family metallopeptidase [Terriglobia bacterium]
MTGMEFLVGCAWRGTVILAAAFAAAVILRRASAALRHLVWTAAFGALLMLPLALPFAPKWGVGPARVTVSVVGQAVSVFGCALSALRFLLGAGLAWWMLRRSTEAGYAAGRVASSAAELGITRRVRVIESAAAVMPMAWGVAHPVVILPAGAGAWPEPRLEAAVLHELVHIRRHDLAAQWLAQAACSLFWFHPLAWLGARQLRSAREQACDDAVLRRGIAPPDYAGRLLDLALTVASRPRTWTQAPAMAEMSDLETRVRALLPRLRA